ncbi:nucleotidyl transferase AbiEii/AbiGii toxin family protein [Mycobacterium riyadhense]|uniref:nucleotidyl transferase AbiEii/AbiGii toxin family protein n=1 Tax=Mycobacterium riyadhense TaxID=486698 RepID=UPI001EFA03EE|nr:nucleotidyl transferase AbiEii/AbiGii toxin family protein [Mycobacterium riyadhense]
MTVARVIPRSVADVVEQLELDGGLVVTSDRLATVMRQVGLDGHKAATRRLAYELQRDGWLGQLRTRHAWEFLPAARGGTYGSGDRLIEFRAQRAVDPDWRGVLAMETAASLLGLAQRLPEQELVALPAEQAFPKALSGDWHYVRIELPEAGLTTVTGLPSWNLKGLTVGIAVRPSAYKDVAGLGQWLPDAVTRVDVDTIIHLLETKPRQRRSAPHTFSGQQATAMHEPQSSRPTQQQKLSGSDRVSPEQVFSMPRPRSTTLCSTDTSPWAPDRDPDYRGTSRAPHQGVRGGRDAALLDIAQDHALHLLHNAGLFARGLVFKGGTALRKFRAGNAGRFSTDLDFTAPDEEVALAALQALDAVEVDGFTFAIENLGDDGRRDDLLVDTPFGRPQLGAKIELARHALSLVPEMLDPVRLPIHDRYDFVLPTTPVVRVEEAVAEKLARYRRVSLSRDLYDLQWFATSGALDEALIRRPWVLASRRKSPISPREMGLLRLLASTSIAT